MTSIIERTLTPDEKRDTVPLGTVDYTKVFRHRIAEHELKCLKEKVPYCRRCSYLDFEKQVRMLKMDYEEGNNSTMAEPKLIEAARNFSFEKYTGKNYHNIASTSAIEEQFFVDMNKVSRHTANYVHFECKGGDGKFKHPLSMRIELKDWDSWMQKFMNKTEMKEHSNPQSGAVKTVI